MHVRLATAPSSWGVDDPRRTDLPPWTRVLGEAAAAGYLAIELGPFGYMPLDRDALAEALATHGLSVIAGTIFDDLVSPDNRANVLRQAEAISALVSALPQPPKLAGQRWPTPYLTIMDFGHDARDLAAGHADRAVRLDARRWAGMVDTIRAAAETAARHGVRAVIHPHAGGHIEFADEIGRIVDDIPGDIAGLCLDTGHLFYAGMDPAAALAAHADRLDYVHFKDVDATVFRRVRAARIRFFEACAAGVMCPIGRGAIDYRGVREALERIGYGGFITIEQERDPTRAGDSLADVSESRAHLLKLGFGED